MSVIDRFRRSLKKEEPISRISMIELLRRGADSGNFSFLPTLVETYSDRVEISLSVVNATAGFGEDPRELQLSLPTAEGQRMLPFNVDEITLFWDTEDTIMRLHPSPCDKFVELTQWVRAYEEGELRVDRAFAEKNLTPEALEYAYMSNAEYYSWNWRDHSASPVIFELAPIFSQLSGLELGHPMCTAEETIASNLSFYTPSYCRKRSLAYDDLPTAAHSSLHRTLYAPDGTELYKND